MLVEQDGIDLGEQGRDVGHDLHAPLGVDLVGVLVDAAGALLDVLAAALVGGDHARAGDVIGRGRVAVQQLGEGGDVRGVGADDADADVGGSGAERDRRREREMLSRWHCTLRRSRTPS